jgi:aspartyl-tRNA(Asn)/glutamyl-tRNA(Gln) amidotransferase subunit A
MTDPAEFNVRLLQRAYASRELSPVEVVQSCLERIADDEPILNAFVGVDAEAALQEARSSERRWQTQSILGPLDGIPTVIKDTMAFRGWPTRKGSRQTDPTKVSTEDAPAAARLRESGVVFLGKTTTPEFGWKGVGDSPLTGITRNPWDTERTTGGSSAGSAAAVATGMTVLATGTDGGGSVRMPAAFCGIFGLKPTFSLVPVYPPSTGGTLSHVGPMTRTVADAAAMMEVIARPDPREIYPVPDDPRPWVTDLEHGVDGVRIAYSPDYGYASVDPRIAAAVERAVAVLSDAGAVVEHIDPPFTDPREDFCTIWDGMLSMALWNVPADRLAESDPGLVATLNRGKALSAHDYLAAEGSRLRLAESLTRLFDTFDLLVSPQMPTVALPAATDVWDPATQDHWTQWTPFTYPHNLSRCPAASVPVGLTDDGLPMAMQIVGRHFEDRLVMRASHAYEMRSPFPQWSSDLIAP